MDFYNFGAISNLSASFINLVLLVQISINIVLISFSAQLISQQLMGVFNVKNFLAAFDWIVKSNLFFLPLP